MSHASLGHLLGTHSCGQQARPTPKPHTVGVADHRHSFIACRKGRVQGRRQGTTLLLCVLQHMRPILVCCGLFNQSSKPAAASPAPTHMLQVVISHSFCNELLQVCTQQVMEPCACIQQHLPHWRHVVPTLPYKTERCVCYTSNRVSTCYGGLAVTKLIKK